MVTGTLTSTRMVVRGYQLSALPTPMVPRRAPSPAGTLSLSVGLSGPDRFAASETIWLRGRRVGRRAGNGPGLPVPSDTSRYDRPKRRDSWRIWMRGNGYSVFTSAVAEGRSGRRGSNPQLQPWEGDGPFLYSGVPDNRLRMSIHPNVRALPIALRWSPSADRDYLDVSHPTSTAV